MKHSRLRSYRSIALIAGAGLVAGSFFVETPAISPQLSFDKAYAASLGAPQGDGQRLPVPSNGSSSGSGSSSSSGSSGNTTVVAPATGSSSQGSSSTSSNNSSSSNSSASSSNSSSSNKSSSSGSRATTAKPNAQRSNNARPSRSSASQSKPAQEPTQQAGASAQNTNQALKDASEVDALSSQKSTESSLEGIAQAASQTVEAGNQTSTPDGLKAAVAQGAGIIGVSGAVAKEIGHLGWGSNTPGYWFTSIWFPIGVAAAASVLIIGLASSAILRSRFKHQEAMQDYAVDMTGQYVAPLIPEMSQADDRLASAYTTDVADKPAYSSGYGSTASPVALSTATDLGANSEDTSVFLRALAESEARVGKIASADTSAAYTAAAQGVSGYSASSPYTSAANAQPAPVMAQEQECKGLGAFDNIDPGDTFIDRMRFKFNK